MKWMVHAVCAALLAMPVAGCAHKGGLKTPTQAKAAEEKKAREAAKRAAREQEEKVEKEEQ